MTREAELLCDVVIERTLPVGFKDCTFSSSKIKVARAARHLAELEVVLASHQASHPPRVIFTEATETENAKIHTTSFTPPFETGAIVGDIVHNLRSALDLMAVEVVQANGNDGSGVHFPFAGNEADLPAMITKRRFDRAGVEAVIALKELMPFKGGNELLRALHDLDILDKHRTLIPASATVDTPSVMADTSSWPPKLTMVKDSTPRTIETFPEDGPLGNRELVRELRNMVALVLEIVSKFEPLVARK